MSIDQGIISKNTAPSKTKYKADRQWRPVSGSADCSRDDFRRDIIPSMLYNHTITFYQPCPRYYLLHKLLSRLNQQSVHWYDKVEDVVLSRVGKFVGITHAEVEKFGQRFSGHRRDFFTLLAIRATPIIPSAPISLVCGFVRIDFKYFVTATFIGTIIRDFVYLYFGYTSIQAAEELMQGLEGIESIMQIVLAGIGALIVGWIIYRRKFNHR